MMSQDSPSDLIETVTAEIEAIIQEEINSQNAQVISEEVAAPKVSEYEPVISEVKTECETVEESKTIENVVETIQSFDATETESDGIKSAEIVENISEEFMPIEDVTNIGEEVKPVEEPVQELQPEIPAENQEQNSNNLEHKEITGTAATEVSDAKEEIVAEYTVQIGSPSQEKTAVPELDDNLVAVPLIETILKDAPIDENDGPRVKHFKQALRKALNNTVKSCSGEKLESCFPFNLKADQFSQINSTILNALKSVIDGVQGPFDEFLKSEKLVEKLNKVDDFTRSRVPGTSEASGAAILASLTPQNLIDRKLYATKLASLSKLEQFAQKLEMENSQLSSKLNNRQTEFADRLDRLKSSQQLLDAALDQISTISMDDLEVLVDKMNHQYQPSALKFQN